MKLYAVESFFKKAVLIRNIVAFCELHSTQQCVAQLGCPDCQSRGCQLLLWQWLALQAGILSLAPIVSLFYNAANTMSVQLKVTNAAHSIFIYFLSNMRTLKVQYCHCHDSMYYYRLPSCTEKNLNTNNILTSAFTQHSW